MKDWKWKPLIAALELRKSMPLLGGNAASVDAALAIEALCGNPYPPEEGGTPADKALMHAAHEAVVLSGGLDALIDVR